MANVIAIDQSTSATKVMLFDAQGGCLDKVAKPHQQLYPQAGWVEHDAEEIWQNLLACCKQLTDRNQSQLDDVACLSITNQRETLVVFDSESGKPLYPAIVWQCRRSVEICDQLKQQGYGELIHQRTGLLLDAYFSGSKIRWLIENDPELQDKLAQGKALIGTIDTYLIYRLTKGLSFVTDHTNASRTLLFNVTRLDWDPELCELWKVPRCALPEIRESSAQFGDTNINNLLKNPCPIVGVMGDSQASLFAQRCFEPGNAKVTLGTGSSVLLNIGDKPSFSQNGIVTALAWVHQGKPTYAFEGIIIHAAATLNWLIDQLELTENLHQLLSLAEQVPDEGGVYLVPAFSGLGLPHWQPTAKALITGLSGHSNKSHIAKAALNSIAYQLMDVFKAMQADSELQLTHCMVDGGPSKNPLLMQFTADVTDSRLVVTDMPDCSAQGAVLMGLIGVGILPSFDSIKQINRQQTDYLPRLSHSTRNKLIAGWQGAVRQVLSGITTNITDN